MDEEEILEMVESGELDSEEIDDFRNLSYELQEYVQSGELTMEEALEIE